MPLHKRCSTTAGFLAYIIEQAVNRGVPSQRFQAFNSSIKKDRYELLVSLLEGETVHTTGSRCCCKRKQRFYLRYQMLVRVIRVMQRCRCLALLSAGVHWHGLQGGEVSLFVCPSGHNISTRTGLIHCGYSSIRRMIANSILMIHWLPYKFYLYTSSTKFELTMN